MGISQPLNICGMTLGAWATPTPLQSTGLQLCRVDSRQLLRSKECVQVGILMHFEIFAYNLVCFLVLNLPVVSLQDDYI